MARCTAPVRGHRSASAAAACPACRGVADKPLQRLRIVLAPSYSSPPGSSGSSGSSGSGGGGSGSSARPRWSPAGSSVSYTPAQVLALTPVRKASRTRAQQPDLRDVFLCHAWDDRQGVAKELHDLLVSRGVKVWFSEKDVGLGVPLHACHRQRLGEFANWDRAGDPCAAASASQKRASPTKSFRHSFGVTGSFPSCTTRRMKLSGKSAHCSPLEAA